MWCATSTPSVSTGRTCGTGLSESNEPERKTEAAERQLRGRDWVSRLPKKAKDGGRSVHLVRGGQRLVSAANVHEPRRSLGQWDRCRYGRLDRARVDPIGTADAVLLEADGKPLVVEKTIGAGRLLVIANGSFLLNEASCQPGASAAGRSACWIGSAAAQSVLLWSMVLRVRGRKDAVALGSALAYSSFAVDCDPSGLGRAPGGSGTCTSPGPSAPDPPSGADRPAEHAAGAGSAC